MLAEKRQLVMLENGVERVKEENAALKRQLEVLSEKMDMRCDQLERIQIEMQVMLRQLLERRSP